MSVSKAEVLVYVFSILLGLNSLISTNGLWVELPLMIPVLPESWSLPSYLTFIIQAANIGPIVYGIFNWKFPETVTERPTCYLMLCIGSSAALLMAFFWKTTVWAFGAHRSIPMLVLTFFLGLVDSLSSMVCFPFMALLKPHYMTFYMIGEGLSGFLPTVFATIQGSSEVNQCENASSNASTSTAQEGPTFSVEIFFYGIFTMLIMSWIGFYLLNNLSICKSEFEKRKFSNIHAEQLRSQKTRRRYFFFLFLQFYVPALFYGVLPSVQSYSCLPYGELPFFLAVILYSMASPLMAVLYAAFPVKRISLVVVLVVFGTVVSGYLLTTAIMSPSPPFKHLMFGKILLIGCWICVAASFGYTKVVVASCLSEMSHRALYWGGVLIQVGATLGATLMFLLVVVFELFHEENHCN